MTTSTSAGASCPRCKRTDATINAKHPVCSVCQAAIRREAQDWQSRDCLARWLSTRASADGGILDSFDTFTVRGIRRVGRFIDEARRLGLTWWNPPQPMTFDQRVAALMRESVPLHAGKGRGVASKAKQVSAAALWVSA